MIRYACNHVIFSFVKFKKLLIPVITVLVYIQNIVIFWDIESCGVDGEQIKMFCKCY